jgi:hypothetical protein
MSYTFQGVGCYNSATETINYFFFVDAFIQDSHPVQFRDVTLFLPVQSFLIRLPSGHLCLFGSNIAQIMHNLKEQSQLFGLKITEYIDFSIPNFVIDEFERFK